MQQHTDNQHGLTKLPNSQITDNQFGDDESLTELFQNKTHIMSDQTLLFPHQETDIFLLRGEGID